MTDVRDRLTDVLDRLPVDVDRRLEAVTTRAARRSRAARIATVGVAAAVAAAGIFAVARLSELRGSARPGAGQYEGRIAYMRAVLRGDQPVFHAYVARGDGSVETPLETTSESEMFPEWSPDGTRVAFVGGPAEAVAGMSLYVAAADGSDAREIVAAGVRGPVAWSPDGTRIAFVRFENRPGYEGSVWVVKADGTEPYRVLRGMWDHVDWSPDGSWLALSGQLGVERCDGSRCQYTDTFGLHVVRVDGSGLRQLTSSEGAEAGSAGFDRFPSWSPDGELIAFVRNEGADDIDYRSDIYTVRADGTGLRRRTDSVGVDAVPAWSPDGTKILFSSDRLLSEEERARNRREENINGVSLFLLDLRTGETELVVQGGDAAVFATSWVA